MINFELLILNFELDICALRRFNSYQNECERSEPINSKFNSQNSKFATQ